MVGAAITQDFRRNFNRRFTTNCRQPPADSHRFHIFAYAPENLLAPAESQAVAKIHVREILDGCAYRKNLPRGFSSHAHDAWNVIDVIPMQRQEVWNLRRGDAELFANTGFIEPVLLPDVVYTHGVG